MPMYIYIYIHIYREREREIEREICHACINTYGLFLIYIYIYICTYIPMDYLCDCIYCMLLLHVTITRYVFTIY